MNSRRRIDQRGSALMVALVVLMMTTAIGAVVVTLATVGHSTVRNGYYREKS